MVYFDGVEVDWWDGDKAHLKGYIRDIVTSDEICVVFLYPGSSVHHNIPSTVSEVQYMYFRGSSGSYDLAAGGRYIPWTGDNSYGIRIIDVSGTCEHWSGERDWKLIDVYKPEEPQPPDIFQYQVIFDLDHPALAENVWRLEAEYAKYAAIAGWLITPSEPDCFDAIRPDPLEGDGISRTGWLCQAVEFGPSGCWPFPWWACPHETEKTIYFRGECSCTHFQDTLQFLGIPCYHLIKAKVWYGSSVPYCPYTQCL